MRKFGSIAIVGAVGCGLLVSCGGGGGSHTNGATTTTTASALSTALQACLEKKGYNVTIGDVPATLAGLYTAFTTTPGDLGTNIIAIGGSSGQGNAVLALFDNAHDAQSAAGRVDSAIADPQTGVQQGDAQAGSLGDAAWYVWTNAPATNADVSACAG